MKNYETIKLLKSNAKKIYDLFERKIPTWQRDPETYDKVRYGFVRGSNSGWYKEIKLHFGAWCGVYGNSSTYKEFHPDHNTFELHFLKVLNENKKDIMIKIAESMEDEAKSLVDKAEAEIKEQSELLQSAK